ncbi:hypothetical protein HK103_003393 [Boothiomyces macroporosus]|uniref:Uncharacterized protein n=1 Tax=Boothiomyces macroporosus TaxID=261099 RepID=A0AAD5UCE6_9FUNG|nr:hypothetical protein HK103_003393 [Boothiomyces macroporosus]
MDYFKSLYETKEQPQRKKNAQKETVSDTYNMTALYDTIVAASTTVANTSATYYEHAVKQATNYFQGSAEEKEQPESKYGRRPSRDTNQRPNRDMDRYNERNERPQRQLNRYNERNERPSGDFNRNEDRRDRSERRPTERRPSDPFERSQRSFTRADSDRSIGSQRGRVVSDRQTTGRYDERDRFTERSRTSDRANRIQPRSQSVHSSRQPTLPRDKVQSLPSTNWARTRTSDERRERPSRQRSY